ncbi:MAG: 16S rRNA pseudouridine(516) synthase, partial [Peptococcaceae bacterium]|nr:16S rRNA pseudouridine(516) synthase [Peptococcaceae bacterium]
MKECSVVERIDKIIASQGTYSRSDVKSLISKKRVSIDGETVKSANVKADPEKSVITIDGR